MGAHGPADGLQGREEEVARESGNGSDDTTQVALPADRSSGHNFRTIHYFIECEKLSHAREVTISIARGVGLEKSIALPSASTLSAFCGGSLDELIDPKDRPRWPRRR